MKSSYLTSSWKKKRQQLQLLRVKDDDCRDSNLSFAFHNFGGKRREEEEFRHVQIALSFDNFGALDEDWNDFLLGRDG